MPIPAQYQTLINEHKAILEVNFVTIPKHNIIHNIDTGTNTPCKAKLRPIPANTPKYVAGKKAWDELEQLGIIEKIGPNENTQWLSALHLVLKSDGSLRPCVDYRALNDRSLLDVYPLPSMKQFSSKLLGSTIFSKVDLYKSYHQIPLNQSSSQKTTLISPYGTYRFRRLAMGLRNSAQSFQKMMNWVLDSLPNVYCYLDDILVHSKNEEEHQSLRP